MLGSARTYTGRILGKTRAGTFPNEMTLFMTGNNIGATGEIARRMVPIHLEADCANPQEKTGFAHPDPVAYARSRQRQVAEATVGMVERFRDAGRPEFVGGHVRRLRGLDADRGRHPDGVGLEGVSSQPPGVAGECRRVLRGCDGVARRLGARLRVRVEIRPVFAGSGEGAPGARGATRRLQSLP